MSLADSERIEEIGEELARIERRRKELEAEKLLRGHGVWHRVEERTEGEGEEARLGVGINGDRAWVPIRHDRESALLALAERLERERQGPRPPA